MPHPDAEPEPASDLARGLDLLTGRFTARGVAIDDNGSGLLRSIEDYAEDFHMPIKIRRVPFQTKDLSAKIGRGRTHGDFALVDHRLDGKYSAFSDGLDAVEAIRSVSQRIPIFYYTAYEQDVYLADPKRPGTLNPRARRILSDPPWTYFYEKAQLQPDRRLNEFVQLIYLSALGYALEQLPRSTGAELHKLLESRVVKRQTRTFRLLGEEAGGEARLQEIAPCRDEAQDVVPSRLLRRAGVTRRALHCKQVVIEFSEGQILSYFAPTAVGEELLSKRALRLLDDLRG